MTARTPRATTRIETQTSSNFFITTPWKKEHGAQLGERPRRATVRAMVKALLVLPLDVTDVDPRTLGPSVLALDFDFVAFF